MEKDKLESKIKKIAEELLSIPEETRTKSEDLTILKTKLADFSWRWAEGVFGKTKIECAGEEIMKCAAACLKNFSGQPDDFIKYLSASLKTQIERANERNAESESSAMKAPEKKSRLAKNAIRYAEENALEIRSDAAQEKIARIFGLPKEKIRRALDCCFTCRTEDEFVIGDDGEYASMFDTALLSPKSRNRYPAEKALLDGDMQAKLKHKLFRIDLIFQKKQERVKPYLSALIMRQILFELDNAKIDFGQFPAFLSEFNFSKYGKSAELLENVASGKDIPTQEETAAMFGKDKTDASRTMRGFLEKMKD